MLAAVVGSGIMGERLASRNVAIAPVAHTIATGATLVALILTFGPISGATSEARPQRELWSMVNGVDRDIWERSRPRRTGRAARARESVESSRNDGVEMKELRPTVDSELGYSRVVERVA